MALTEITPPTPAPLPSHLLAYLDEARTLAEELMEEDRPGFIPCDYEIVGPVLHALIGELIPRRAMFLEWGSGLAVVAGLAAGLGLRAHALELDEGLVDASRSLHDRHDLAVDLERGNFVPQSDQDLFDVMDEFAWLESGGPDGYDALSLEPNSFDLFFAFPWPGEEDVVGELFERCAQPGAYLMTYHGPTEGVRLRRK